MTGHVVLTTLHTTALLGYSALNGYGRFAGHYGNQHQRIVAQRLVRKLCVKCKRKKENLSDLDKAVLPKLYPDVDFKKSLIQESVGCAVCEYQGYRGRAAVMNCFVLMMNWMKWFPSVQPLKSFERGPVGRVVFFHGGKRCGESC